RPWTWCGVCGRSPFGSLFSVRPPALAVFVSPLCQFIQGGQVMARARKQVRRITAAGQADAGKPVGRVARRAQGAQASDLVITHRHAAGIDIHAAEHFVAVAAEDVPAGFVNPDRKLPVGVRKFGTNTCDLEAIADWLKACGVTTVAMESTGVYWI